MARRIVRLFLLLLLPFISFRVSSLFAQEPHHAIELHLQVGTFDPLVDAPQVAPPMQAAESGTQTYLVQFKGPITEAWKAEVTGAGAQLYGYVPDYSLIARMDDAALAQVRAFPFVRWVGPYHPAYRLSPELSAAHTTADANLLVDVELLPGIDLDRVAARVNQLGGAVRERAANQFASSLRVSIPGARIADLAALDGVLWLEPTQEMVLLNDLGGGGIMRVEAVRQSLGLYGRGQIVGVADTGLDTGQKTNLHADLRGRLIQGFCLGRTSPCDWSDPNGHGTHVAGSVLGNGAASGSNPSTHSYAGSFAGTAPEAQLVFQSIEGPSGTLSGIPLDHGNLMRQGYQQGARIHTNSWGGRTCANPPSCTQFGYGGYETSSVNVDRVAWEQKDMLILFAAGNDGTDANANGVVDPDSMMQPGTAKNALTVGASENNRAAGGYNPAGPCSSWGDCWPDKYPASPISADLPSDNPNGMAAFSGRGPTDDGRIKPEVVAPGTNILSLNSHHPNAGAGAWGPYDEDYVYMGGTSMATPLVAGAAALVREYYVRLKQVTHPSAALLKATLLNGAAGMAAGQYGADSTREIPAIRPNNVNGWGRVDLVGSLSPLDGARLWFVDNNGGLSTGQVASYELAIAAPRLASEDEGQFLERGPQFLAAGTPPAPATRTFPPGGMTLDEWRGRHDPAAVAGRLVSVAGAGASVAAIGMADLIQNGGFETDTAWEFRDASYSTEHAHRGSRSARSTPSAFYSAVFQQVSIADDVTSATLGFAWKNVNPHVSGPTPTDYLTVSFYDTSWGLLAQSDLKYGTSDTAWHTESLAFSGSGLDAIRGKDVYVTFEFSTDWQDPEATFYVDSVSLNVSSATPTPTRTPTATPTRDPNVEGPFRVTLVWTDYPGQAFATRALVNDLDLEVVAPDGTRYYGNRGVYPAGHRCVRDASRDRCNNAETVYLPEAPRGNWKLIVSGFQVAQGGQQPFAIVASGDGLTEVLGSTPSPTSAPATSTPTATATPSVTRTPTHQATNTPTRTTVSPTATPRGNREQSLYLPVVLR